MDREARRRYAEEFGLVYSRIGMPPAYGKLLGWMLICDPPVQSSGELADALQLSKGSVSTGMRMLVGAKLARRVARPGQRGHAYELLPDALITATSDAGALWSTLSDLMARGVDLIGDEEAPEAQRLRVARDYFAFIARRVPELLDEFKIDNGR
jgi:DNA-binding transcriptional regulator GbsR (MarR family)